MTARRVVVSGRVQGVFYRDSTRREAVRLGVAGWVRNRADGTVEALLEGDDEAVGALEAWMADGPPHAVVDAVEATATEAAGLQGFEIR